MVNKILEIKENNLYFLYRRGRHEHIQALYDKGEIYINTIDELRRYDENLDRSDLHDGIKERKHFDNPKVTICDIGKDIEKDGVTIKAFKGSLQIDSNKKGHIYCLSGISGDHLLGERNEIVFNTISFGESLIFIYNPVKFIDRVRNALKREGYDPVNYGRVKYYADDYSGPVGPFRKHERFKDQNEYRIFIPNTSNNPIKINIGTLNDIAAVDINNSFAIKYTDGKIQNIWFEPKELPISI